MTYFRQPFLFFTRNPNSEVFIALFPGYDKFLESGRLHCWLYRAGCFATLWNQR